MTGARWRLKGNRSLGSTGRRSNDRKQPAGSRSEIMGKWGKKQNGVSVERRDVRQWRNVNFCSLILHHQMYVSHPTGLEVHHSQTPPSLIPASSRFSPPRDLQTSLYLDTHQGLWHRISSTTLLTVISKRRGCQTVYYYQTIRRRTRLHWGWWRVTLQEDTCWIWQQIIAASLQVLSQPL